jgi:hypothetical protein
MLPESINLLPEDRIRAFRRGYFFRVLALAAALLTFLALVHAILLLPTHLLLSAQISARQGQLDVLKASGVSADEAVFEARLADLAKSATRIEALGSIQPTVKVLTEILQVPHARVSLSGFSYAAPSGTKKASSAILTGVAATRDDLQAYQLALKSASFVSAADLPVSTYAKETKIPFTITLTLTLP